MKWIEELSEAGTLMTAGEGDTLYYEGLSGGDLFVVIEGRVSLYADVGPMSVLSGKTVKIADVTKGGFLGAEGFFDENVFLCTATVDAPSRLLRLARANAMLLVQNSPEAMYHLNAAMTSTLRGLKAKLSEVIALQKDTIEECHRKIAVLSEIKPAPPPTPPAPLRPETPKPKPAPAPVPAVPVSTPTPTPAPAPVPKPAPMISGPLDLSSLMGDAPITTILPPGHPRYEESASEAHSKFLGSKSFTCPCCQKDFSDLNILSFKLKTQTVKDDMRVIHDGIETLWYSVRVCPKCNAAALSPIFSKFTSRDSKLMRISNYSDKVPRFCGFSKPRTLNEVLEAYYLALYCIKHIDNDPMSRAQIWRRLMWLYDDIGDQTLQNIALDNTLECYQTAYSTKHLNAGETFHLNIVLGDLCARKGERNSAYRYFYEAIHGEDKSNQVLIRHAQDMIAELRHGGES